MSGKERASPISAALGRINSVGDKGIVLPNLDHAIPILSKVPLFSVFQEVHFSFVIVKLKFSKLDLQIYDTKLLVLLYVTGGGIHH